jgi:hypothetical protein
MSWPCTITGPSGTCNRDPFSFVTAVCSLLAGEWMFGQPRVEPCLCVWSVPGRDDGWIDRQWNSEIRSFHGHTREQVFGRHEGVSRRVVAGSGALFGWYSCIRCWWSTRQSEGWSVVGAEADHAESSLCSEGGSTCLENRGAVTEMRRGTHCFGIEKQSVSFGT